MSNQSEMIIENTGSNYSYTSRKFWCTSCQRGFSALRMDDTDVHCPRCDSIAMEFLDQSVDLNRLNRSNNTIETNQTQQNHNIGSSQRRPESPRSTQSTQNTQQNQRNDNRGFFQRGFFGAPTGHFVYVETFSPFGSSDTQQQPSNIFEDFFGFPFGGSSQANNQSNGLFGGLFSAFNPFFNFFGGAGRNTNEEYERLVEEFLRNDPNQYGPAPASEESINRLKEEEFNPNEGEKACPICQDDFKEGEKVLRLPCKHDYHRECVTKWLHMHNSCPTCRAPLKEEGQH